MRRFQLLLLSLSNAVFVLSLFTMLLTLAAREARAQTGTTGCTLPAGCTAAPCPGTICIGVNCMGCTSNAMNTCSC
jgi:hypothetical protein